MDMLYTISTQLYAMSGFAEFTWHNFVMYLVGGTLIFLAITKKFEPLLLIPIGFGAFLANFPQSGLGAREVGGIMNMIYEGGLKSGIMPPIIFMGIGAMTDFRPLLARPITFLLAAAAQLGIFLAALGAYYILGFTSQESAAIGIIGSSDGPTTLYLTTMLAPHLLGPVAVAAYSYMAMVPIIQPPILKLCTTQKEREIDMPQEKEVSKVAVILFPIVTGILTALIVPEASPLIAMLMFGNLLRESGVTDRLSKTTQTTLIDVMTTFLALCVGSTMAGQFFLRPETLGILFMGLFAFATSTAAGILFARFMNLFLPEGKKLNPCIGAAAVSANPMSARTVQTFVSKHTRGRVNPLMAAMGPNIAGVVASAFVAGVFIALFK